MKYFIDTEFLEGTQKKWFGQTKPTIDLISIGIVCDDGREYYAISKDFNLKEAWNRWQPRTGEGDRNNIEPRYYWIRENVLKPIFEELLNKWAIEEYEANSKSCTTGYDSNIKSTYKGLKRLINKYGKTNKQIAEEIKEFCKPIESIIIREDKPIIDTTLNYKSIGGERTPPEFYGYYSDYDWVVFCWLFGRMIDLPKGFPMYCIDLKQELDRYSQNKIYTIDINTIPTNITIQDYINKYVIKQDVTKHPKYPKQTNEHNALADARWNFELYKFLNTL